MRLVISRRQQDMKGMLGGHKGVSFTLGYRLQLTPEESSHGAWLAYTPKIDPLPAENLRAVCATREGCVLRFWRLARRLWIPEHGDRGGLTSELIDRLGSLGCPDSEAAFIRDEIAKGFPWLSELYSEAQV